MSRLPNILLVTVDSLRADDVSSPEVVTPTYDSLASTGSVYTNAFSQGPFTTFSMPSLFTSRYPSGLKYLEFSENTIGVYIDDEPTLPDQLQTAGYETAGFHSNPLLSNLFGFDRGFDTFDAQLPLAGVDWLSGRGKILADKLLRAVRTHAYLPAEQLTARAVDWLRERDGDRPFFLWVHYMDVHGPYQAKEGYTYLNKYRGERLWRKALKRPQELTAAETERLRELYRGEIEYTDDCIGMLLEELRRRGLYDETVTVFTADHGELFGEYGQYSHPHLLHDELTNVPLVVRSPGGDSRQFDEVVELVDVAPTLLKTAGIDCPDSFAGVPLGSTTEQTAISEADLVPAYNGSVRTPTHRYVRDDTEPSERLYRIDDSGARDVTEREPDIRTRLSERLDEHLATPGRSVGTGREVTEQSIDDSDIEGRLQDLGYLE